MRKKFRIGLLAQGGHNWVGGVEYVKNIIFTLSRVPESERQKFELCLIVNKATAEQFIAQVRPFLDDVFVLEDMVGSAIQTRILSKLTRIVLDSPSYNKDAAFNKYGFDFIYPYFSQSRYFVFEKSAAWIPDFQHVYLPEFFGEAEIQARCQSFGIIAEKAPAVVFSSKTSEGDFRRLYPEFAHKSRVLKFHTVRQPDWHEKSPLATQNKFNLPDKFFIVCNQFWKHKNHKAVFEALRILQNDDIRPVVVFTGHIYDYRNPGFSDEILKAIHQMGVAEQVYLLGLVDKADQIQLVRRALAVVQPSLFEGWSSVVEDARCLGKTIILSDLPVHQEQAPPYSVFFDRSAPKTLGNCMAEAWEKLSPGPSVEREEIALVTNRNDVEDFAKAFLKIAKAPWVT